MSRKITEPKFNINEAYKRKCYIIRWTEPETKKYSYFGVSWDDKTVTKEDAYKIALEKKEELLEAWKLQCRNLRNMETQTDDLNCSCGAL